MSADKSLAVAKFRSLARSFERFAEKGLTPTRRGVDPGQLAQYMDLCDHAGKLIVHAFRCGYLPAISGLKQLVDWLDDPPDDRRFFRVVLRRSFA